MNVTENPETNAPPKKPYLKPRLRRVELRPQEAVLGNCKSLGGTVGGGAAGTCDTIACQSQGS
jgi:hypothetical protein